MKPSTKRLVSFTAAFLMIIGTLVVFFNLIQPAYHDSQDLKAKILSQQNSLKNEQSAATQVQSLIQQYRGNQSPQEAVSNALPLENDQAQVIHTLQALAAANQLAVQSVAVSQPGAKPPAPIRGESSVVKPIGVINAQIRVTGTYAGFKRFLASVETNIRVTDISSLVVTPVGKPNQDFYSFDLTITAYYQSS